MKYSFLRFPNFLLRAVTLSYDDGVKHDETLVNIIDKYGLKCTFNINSGFIGNENKLTAEEILSIYGKNNHEIAVHGVNHFSLSEVSESMMINDIINDRRALEKLCKKPIFGMAYANGVYDDKAVEILKRCGIHYARTVEETEWFDLPNDWLRMPSTCHHGNHRLMELAKEFIETPENDNFWWNSPRLFYMWGHSYEYDYHKNWNVLEEFCKYIGGRENVWYATNGEIYDYVQAFNRIEYSVDGEYATNPSATDVYICYFGVNNLIPAGQTVKLKK